MAIQSSGTITIQDIVDEFGGTTPHSLSEYYRNGSFVPGNNTGVPTSGLISISDFYGGVNEIVIQTGNATNLNLASVFGSGWTSTVPKRLIIPSGITVGGTNTHAILAPAGMAGTLVMDITGNVHGYGGASNGGTGGNAIHLLSTSGVTINLNSGGNILAGGGGGGQGGQGGQGGTGGNGGQGGTGLLNGRDQFAGGSGGSGGAGGAGGQGGAGGVGQGYNQSAGSGSAGAAGASGNAGSGGSPGAGSGGYAGGTGGNGGQGGQGGQGGHGGAGGSFGNSGSAGTGGSQGSGGSGGGTGSPGNCYGNCAFFQMFGIGNPSGGSGGSAGSSGSGGSAGGIAGYYIFGRSSITFNNSGTVAGR